MADLGNLKFKIFFEEDAKNLENIRKKAEKLVKGLKVDGAEINVDEKYLQKKIRKAIGTAPYQLKLSVDTEQFKKEMEVSKKEIEKLKTSMANLSITQQTTNSSIANGGSKAAGSMGAANGMVMRLNSNMKLTSSLAMRLGQNFQEAFSLYLLKGFFQKLVQIGGEIENQKIALTAMLQDAGKAQDLFIKVKSLAIRSPFGVLDLNQYAKQLSAYQVPYNELYDTMKRLADISAGVGVDMGRIILAFGQVKAAKFLKGTELRQFTEANIPMVDKLSEKFSKLEGRMVSAGEILEMISKKKISFEDVKEVLWDLTGDGGMFHNMQEVLAQSVKSKWKNAKDALEIMLADMTESFQGAFVGSAEAVTELTKRWKEFVPALRALGIGYMAVRVGSKAFNSSLYIEMQSVNKTLLAAKKKEAAILSEAKAYRQLTTKEEELIQTRNKLTGVELKAAAQENMLTKEMLLRSVAYGKVSKAEAMAAAKTLGLSKAAIDNVKTLSVFKRVSINAAAGFKSIASGIASFFSPSSLALVGLSVAYQLYSNMQEKARQLTENIRETGKAANEAFKNLTTFLGTLEKGTSDTLANLSDGGLIVGIEKMSTKLKDYALDWADTFDEVFKKNAEGEYVYSLAEQYEKLRDALNETKDAYKGLAKYKDMMFNANEKTDGYFDESFLENLEDYSDKVKDFNQAITNLAGNSVAVTAALKNIKSNDKELAESLSGKSLFEQVKYLINNGYQSKLISEISKKTSDDKKNKLLGDRNDLIAAFVDKGRAFNDVKEDYDKFKEDVEKYIAAHSIDLSKATNKETLRQSFDKFLKSKEGLDEEVFKDFTDLFYKDFGLEVKKGAEELDKDIVGFRKNINKHTNDFFKSEIRGIKKAGDVAEHFLKKWKDNKEAIEEAKKQLVGKEGITDSFHKSLREELAKAKREREAMIKLFEYLGLNPDEELKKEKKKSGRKGSKDALLDKLKERLRLLQKAHQIYQNWLKVVGKDAALAKVKESGIFDDAYNGKIPFNLDKYRDELEKLEKEIRKAGLGTRQRREYVINIKTLVDKIDREELKRNLLESKKILESEFKKINRSWNVYDKLMKAGARKKDALGFAFGGEQQEEKRSSVLAKRLQQQLDKVNIELPLDVDEEEAVKILGGVGSLAYNQFYEKWLVVKGLVTKEALQTKLDQVRVLKKYESIKEKIDRLNEDYEEKTGLKVGESGELEGDTENKNAVQKAFIMEYTEELIRLKSEMLVLTPLWADLFHNKLEIGYSKLIKITDKVGDIIKSAKIIKNEAGKPIGFVGQTKNDKGKLESYTGTYAELVKLIKEHSKLTDSLINKNPFRTMTTGLIELTKATYKYIKASKKGKDGKVADEDKFKKAKEQLGGVAKVVAKSMDEVTKQSRPAVEGMVNLFEAMGDESTADAIKMVVSAMDSLGGMAADFAKGNIFSGIMQGAGFVLNIVADMERAKREQAELQLKLATQRVAVQREYLSLLREEIALNKQGSTIFGEDEFGNMLANRKAGILAINDGLREIVKSTSIANSAIQGNDKNGYLLRMFGEKNASFERVDELRAKGKGAIADVMEQYLESIGRIRGESGKLNLAENFMSFADAMERNKGLMHEYLKSIEIVSGSHRGGTCNKKVIKEYSGILEIYPELIDQNGQLNLELAKSILANREMTEEDKKQLELVISTQEEIQKYTQAMTDYLNNIFGELGQSLTDALVESFRNGSDEAKNFQKSVAKTFEKLTTDMLKHAIIQPVLEKYGKKIEGVVNEGLDGEEGYNKLAEIVGDFSKEYEVVSEQFHKSMKAAQEGAAKNGVEIYMPDDKSNDALRASIKGIQERQADIIASYLNAIRADVSVKRERVTELVNMTTILLPQVNTTLMSQQVILNGIESNTRASMVAVKSIQGMLEDVTIGTKKLNVQ